MLLWVFQPIPLNIGNLMSAPAIVFATSTVETKFRLAGLPCPIFTALVLIVFIELLGDKSLDITFGEVCSVVGEL